jgi:hypothetical protein
MAHTEKAVRAAKKGCYLPFKYDFETPDPLLMLLIGVAYSTITPLIVPFAIMYFIAAQVCHGVSATKTSHVTINSSFYAPFL